MKTAGMIFVFLILLGTSGYASPIKEEWLFPEHLVQQTAQALLKERVWERLKEVEDVARLTRGLDSLGRATMPQSVALLELGPAAIEPLSSWLLQRRQEWRLRYWVVDLLGFLKDPKALSPLSRVIQDNRESKIVRLRAVRSMEELGFPEAAEGLKKIAPKVREGDVKMRIASALKKLETSPTPAP